MKKKLAIIITICMLAGMFSSCSRGSRLDRYQATFLTLFDTVTTISGYAENKEIFSETTQRIHDELAEYHQLFDIYNDYEGINNLKTINDNAGIAPVKVDGRIIDMLDMAYDMYGYTNGMMNVAMGSVLALWHDAREYGIENPEASYLPDAEALKLASKSMDIEKLIINKENSTVYLAEPGMSLDVGAIGKGYAVEAVCSSLEKEGLDHYVVNVGGNVRTIGTKADGTGWKVGVEDPEGKEKYLLYLSVSDKTIVTSGSYQRYYTVDGVRYHHIISPESLYPENQYLSVTIISDNSALADALSTALFNMDQGQGESIIESFKGTEAMWVYADGTMFFSSGFKSYIVEG